MCFQALLLLCVLAFTAPAIADEITIVADEWAPYCGKPGAAQPGYGIEIAQHVFNAAGHNVLYKVVPWTRAIIDTRNGKYNAIVGAAREEAPDFVFPEEEIGMARDAFFVKKGSTWTYKGLDSLRTKTIGAIKGYSYGEELDAYFKENARDVQYVFGEDPLRKNIDKLLAGRFDVLIEDENALLHKVKAIKAADKVVNAGATGESIELYITFSPKITKSNEYAEILTKGLRQLKKSGKLEKILAKYGLTYWK